MSLANHQYNVVLIGDSGVGKTSFLHKHQTGEFLNDYHATADVQDSPLPWATTAGHISMTVWDIPGTSQLSSRSKEALGKADAAIIMFDVCDKATLDHVAWWAWEVHAATNDSLPIVVCGNKADKLAGGHFRIPEQIQHEYYNISTLNNLNLFAPWFYLLQHFLNDPSLELAEPICVYREAPFSEFYADEMERAATKPLPDEDNVDT